METSTRKEDRIFKIIDSVLKQVFGEEATSFIYKYIEQNYFLGKNEFSKKIDVFAKGLEECLSSGAFIIEGRILEEISAVYGISNKASFKKELREYNFANQMKLYMQQA